RSSGAAGGGGGNSSSSGVNDRAEAGSETDSQTAESSGENDDRGAASSDGASSGRALAAGVSSGAAGSAAPLATARVPLSDGSRKRAQGVFWKPRGGNLPKNMTPTRYSSVCRLIPRTRA